MKKALKSTAFTCVGIAILASLVTRYQISERDKRLAGLETRVQTEQHVHQEQANESLPKINVFDLSLHPGYLASADDPWFDRLDGRIRNESSRGLGGLTLNVIITDADGKELDTHNVALEALGVDSGMTKAFSQAVEIRRLPKNFKWRCKITDGTFY